MKSTVKDVAELAGVGLSTVSRVINGNYPVSEEKRQRVLEAIEELDYRPNAVARSLKSQKTWLIGAIVADISNPFYMQLIKGVESVISEKDYSIIIASTEENTEKEQKIVNLLLDRQVDGLVITTCQTEGEFFKNLKRANTPIVMADRQIYDIKYDFVVEDNEYASYKIVSHLIKLGHRKICIVAGDSEVSTLKERYLGYIRAHKEFGIPVNKKLVVDGRKNGTYDNLHKFFNEISKEDYPSAIFTINNTRADSAIQVLLERNIKVPEDISFASYGNITNPYLYPVKLTHVMQDVMHLGEKTGEILLQRLSNDNGLHTKEYVIQASICYGDSVKNLKE